MAASGTATTTGAAALALRPFQRRFLKGAFRAGVRTAAMSLARGNGKSSLVAWLALRALTPGDPLFVAGTESHIAAASVGQARRTTFRLLREFVDGAPNSDDYRVAESALTCWVVHKPSNTRVSVLASKAKNAQGLVRCPLLIADEPGAWETIGGEALHEAVQTAMGKPGCSLRALYVGTLAPALRGWWHDLVKKRGSRGSTYVQALQGDPEKWDRWPEIKRVNPLMASFPESRAVLLDERDLARSDSRRKASFLSFRLNVPTRDESTVLLTVQDWQRIEARDVPPPRGRPVVGIDLGSGRAWSTAVGIWPNGRTEAAAVAPGLPGLAEQERRDQVPAGCYSGLALAGSLRVATGLRVPRPGQLLDMIRGWNPAVLVCDRHRVDELRDAGGRFRIAPRVTRWSEAAEDIRALRRYAADGPLSVEPGSRSLIAASLAVATIRSDDMGNFRLVKGDSDNKSRDDTCSAWVLAAGALSRAPRPARGPRLHVVGGTAA